MTPTTTLFDLIKAMSPAERRYYKIFSSRHLKSEKNLYRQLFDAVYQQDDFNESSIKQQFKDEAFTAQLSRKKNYLYHSILDGLFIFHQNSKTGPNLGKKLQQAQILFDKSLYEQSIVLLTKTITESELTEDFFVLHEALRLLKRCHSFSSFAGISRKEFEALLEKEKEVALKLENIREFQNLESMLLLIFYKSADFRTTNYKKEITSILESPLLKNESNAITSHSRRIYYNIFLFYNTFVENNLQKAYYFGQKHLQETQEKYQKGVLPAHLYAGALNNLIFTSLELGKFKEAKHLCGLMREILNTLKQQESKSVCARVFSLYIYQYFNLLIYSAAAYNEKVMTELEAEMKAYRKYIEVPRKVSILYQFAYYYFLHGDHTNALRWVQLLQQDHVSDERKMIINTASLLKLLINFEQNNEQQLSIAVAATERFLIERTGLQEYEHTIINFLKESLTLKNKSRLPALCTQTIAQLSKLEANTPAEKLRLRIFDAGSWLQAQCEGKSFLEIVKEKAKASQEELSFIA